MKNIGKYNGIPCYECTHKEYVNARNGKLDDGRQIFIIDGTMVKNNIIVGYYDGKSVDDVYDMKTYLRSDEAKTAQARPITPNASITPHIENITSGRSSPIPTSIILETARGMRSSNIASSILKIGARMARPR